MINIRILLLVVFFAGSQLLQAQHCEFDHVQLISIFPHAENSNEIIHGLKITYTDSLGTPVMANQTRFKDWSTSSSSRKEPLILWRNPSVYAEDTKRKSNLKKLYIDFAKKYYLLTHDFYKKNVFIKIEDTDNEHNNGHFETQLISIPKGNMTGLCGYREFSSEFKNAYKPFEVTLKRSNKPQKNTSEKQIGDYNFDGFEDYRILKKGRFPSHDYFIFNTHTNSYEKDDFLSSLQNVSFNWIHKTFQAWQVTYPTELSRQIDEYDFYEGKLMVVHRNVCTQESKNSERSDCAIYKLKNGVLEFSEIQYGAE